MEEENGDDSKSNSNWSSLTKDMGEFLVEDIKQKSM